MNAGPLTEAAAFLIQVVFDFYIILVLLRMLLQWVRADFYNPLSQFVVKLTTPPLRPLRRVVPAIGGIDTSSVVLAWLLMAIQYWLLLMVFGLSPATPAPLLWAIPGVLATLLNIFLFAIIVQAILSWVNPGSYHPAAQLLFALTEPVLRPFRQWIKPVSGIDLSPMVAILALYLIQILALKPLAKALGSPFL